MYTLFSKVVPNTCQLVIISIHNFYHDSQLISNTVVKYFLTQLTLMYNLVDPWASSSNLETANEWKGKEKGTFFDNLASYWSAFFCPYLSFIWKGNPLSFSVRNCKNQTENFSYFFTLVYLCQFIVFCERIIRVFFWRLRWYFSLENCSEFSGHALGILICGCTLFYRESSGPQNLRFCAPAAHAFPEFLKQNIFSTCYWRFQSVVIHWNN